MVDWTGYIPAPPRLKLHNRSLAPMLNKRPRTFHALPDRQSVSPSHNLRTQQTINDGMALLNRSHVLTRLQLTYRLLPWSRTLDQNWPQATTLWPPFSTTCFQAVSTQYSITVANARIPAPNFLLGYNLELRGQAVASSSAYTSISVRRSQTYKA